MIESGLAFLFSWNNFECCGINLGGNFMIRGKMWVLRVHQLRATALQVSDPQPEPEPSPSVIRYILDKKTWYQIDLN